MKIQVTEKHIATGARCSGSHCPIALALNDLGYQSVIVSRIGLCFYDSRQFNLPPSPLVLTFIEAFDAGKDVEPFEFDLDI